jgi:hypothetical protein
MKYNVLIKYKNGNIGYLSHKHRMSWGIKTACKHMRDVNNELINNSPKWVNVDYFAIVLD